jgi:hypothetical protein
MGEMRNAYKILIEMPEGKITLAGLKSYIYIYIYIYEKNVFLMD